MRGKTQAEAKTIFAMALRYMKEHVLDSFKEKGKEISNELIRWVLTVPAIWSEVAKAFMRAAALEGGLITETASDKLLIALEPEAASLYCKTIDVDSAEKTASGAGIFPGTVYMLVDAGGGTVDITVHEVLSKSKVKEITKATGGPQGGTNVDAAFHKILSKVIKKDFIDALKRDLPGTWLNIENSFEKCKREAKPNSGVKLNVFSVSWSMASKYQRMYSINIIEAAEASGIAGVTITEESTFALSSEVVDELFEETIQAITIYLEELLRKPELHKLEYIFLVGGFSTSPYLTKAIRTKFGDRAKVIVPDDPAAAVLRGAVMFGQNPEYVRSRIARKSYGYEVTPLFDAAEHKEEKKITMGDTERCKDVFSLFVKKNSEINVDKAIVKIVSPVFAGQRQICIKIYESDLEDVSYIDDEETKKIGEVDVPVEFNLMLAMFGIDRPIEVSFYFGGTELKMIAEDKSCEDGATRTLRMKIDDV